MKSWKKPEEREARIVWRLENMIRASEQLKDHWPEKAMAAEDKYIRVCGESVRVVSLADDSALCRFKGFGPRKSVAALAARAQENLSSEGMNKAVATAKEERRLQAHLIKSALLNDRDMLGTLKCLSEKLKSLLFAYDEISFGDRDFRKYEILHEDGSVENRATVRLDILAVGTNHSDESFPVVIELKSRRSKTDLKRLLEQLDDAKTELTREKALDTKATERLLESATGIKPTQPDQVMKIVIWPAGRDTQEIKDTLVESQKDAITIIEYRVDDNFPSSTQFLLR